MDEWLNFLNLVGTTFWRGFPYDIAALVVILWGYSKTGDKWLRFVAIFLAALITINLAIGTIPPWFELKTW